MEERFTVDGPRVGVHAEVTLRAGRIARVRLLREPALPDTPSPSAAALHARDVVARHLETGAEDLGMLPVDLADVAPFHRRVLEHIHRMPPGETVTYGELAARVGSPGASRAVGGAMASNPIPLVVPCHRVVAASGRLGNYSGEGGAQTKRRLLELERAPGFHERAAPGPTQTRLAL